MRIGSSYQAGCQIDTTLHDGENMDKASFNSGCAIHMHSTDNGRPYTVAQWSKERHYRRFVPNKKIRTNAAVMDRIILRQPFHQNRAIVNKADSTGRIKTRQLACIWNERSPLNKGEERRRFFNGRKGIFFCTRMCRNTLRTARSYARTLQISYPLGRLLIFVSFFV